MSDNKHVKFLGIEWAPLNISFERRMQTAVTSLWFFNVAFSFCINTAIIYFLIVGPFMPVVLLYLWWMYYDWDTCDTGGRRYPFLRKMKIWNRFRDFFPIKLIKTAEIPPTKNYLFCAYPHGFLASGVLLNFGTEANNFSGLFPGLKPHVLTLSLNFKLPFSREMALALGGCSVSKKSILNILNKKTLGHVGVLVVGGAAESLNAKPGNYKIIIKNRKGFVKLALKTGADLVPVISFGENDYYEQFRNQFIEKFQICIRRIFGFVPLVPRGRGFFQYTFGLVPHRRPINTVVGKPLTIPKIDNPSEEDVNTYHRKFMEELEILFNNNKAKYDAIGDKAQLIME